MLTARDACKADAPKILALIQALADYEHAAHDVTAGIEDIRERLFGPTASVAALMFEHARETVGFAVYFHNFSTWLGRHGLFLEDLYIEPGYRRRGFGRAAMRLLAERALDLDCARFEWNVLNWNTPAIELYEAIGATAQTEWIGYRLEGDALRRFVAAG